MFVFVGRLSLTIDYAFKKFFVSNPDLLMDFLNALFRRYGDFTIESPIVQNPELPGEAIDDKNAILDILARDSRGRKINIEMQAHEIAQFAKRSAFYAFRLYVQGIEKGQDHNDIPPVYSVNLLDFVLFPGLSYHRCFRLLDTNDPSVCMMGDIEFHFIELPRVRTEIESLSEPLDIWSLFIRNSERLTEDEMAAIEKKNPAMKKAHEALDEISMDSDSRLAYDRRKSALFFYEKTLDAKYEEGKVEGILQGKIETARAMLKKGYPLNEVSALTELTVQELENLSEQK